MDALEKYFNFESAKEYYFYTSAVKYFFRAGKKGGEEQGKQDLQKARYCAERLGFKDRKGRFLNLPSDMLFKALFPIVVIKTEEQLKAFNYALNSVLGQYSINEVVNVDGALERGFYKLINN